ncbi:glycosyltransferase family 2 protein [soil metagenome]
MTDRSVAVLIPCFNEAQSIAGVVRAFKAQLPDAQVWVYDNNSTDATRAEASAAGALVRSERLQGKGNVVRRMFADIDADVFVLVDGDGTYEAATAPAMIEQLIADDLDMVVGLRVQPAEQAYRRGHEFGNRLLTGMTARLFHNQFADMLSGYRVFSRRFVKSFPSLSSGFEIETELTVHALELRLPIREVPTPYGARPPGSSSKLNTYSDGARILRVIVTLYKDERPLRFFLFFAVALLLLGLASGIPVVIEYFQIGLVPRLPRAVLATGLCILSALNVFAGLILDNVTRGRREIKRLAYLSTAKRAP